MLDIPDKKILVERLDIVLDKLAKKLSSGFEFRDYVIYEDKVHSFSLYDVNGELLYGNLFTFSTAMALAECLYHKNIQKMKRILYCESKLSKFYHDSLFYKNAKMWDMYENARLDAQYYLEQIHQYVPSKI